jgi:hypothetical protein
MICDGENYEGRFVFNGCLICRAKADLGVFCFVWAGFANQL